MFSTVGIPLLPAQAVAFGQGGGGCQHLEAFDDETCKLLTEMASDLSFALDNLDRQAELIRYAKELERGRAAMLSVLEDQRTAQAALQQKTGELLARNETLTRFNRVAVDRELRMVELKQEVNALLDRLGQARRYRAAPDGSATAPEGLV